MDLIMLLKAVMLAIVCGVTEFLPVSSNGHVIVLKELMGFEGPPGKLFEMSLQLGAIAAVCWLYRAKILHTLLSVTRSPADRRFAFNVIVACLPALIVGAVFHHTITEHLFNARVVATMLILGGIIMLIIERASPVPVITHVDDLNVKTALIIGLCQVLSLVPGVSRSGATIMGALLLKVERRTAT
jgi:undecaprenyl-diphosphatase